MSHSKYNQYNYEITDIFPPLSTKWVKGIIQEYDEKLAGQITETMSLENLPDTVKIILKKIFITKTLNNPIALKARFKQVLEFRPEFKNKFLVTSNLSAGGSFNADFVYEDNDDDDIIWVTFIDYFDKMALGHLQKSVLDILEKEKKNEDIETPTDLYIVCGKIDRKIARENSLIRIENSSIRLSYLIEFQEEERKFTDHDLILINDLKIRGFNFGSTEEIINYLKSKMGPGKYQVLAETESGETVSIWEGILFPKQLLSN